jgi:hypothetical protein
MQDQAQQLAQVVSVFRLANEDVRSASAPRREPQVGLAPRLA